MFDRLERKRIVQETEAKMQLGKRWDDMFGKDSLKDSLIELVEMKHKYGELYEIAVVTKQPLWFKWRARWRRLMMHLRTPR